MEKPKPELKHYLEKRILVKIHGKRSIIGVLSGYDEYMNLVLDEAYDASNPDTDKHIPIGMIMIRGNSILSVETIDPVHTTK
ncbi:LSM domain containing protein [Entamoeba histolytica HM-1:IMSS-B]|uniref:Small nuclear ribonucleoprotein G n=8 Tax=Entamoeba TaxID=5758 RepID=C4M4I4_ENTH1|nr:LSM domain containing protein [Entamoeba nuttalli P19]XP_650141.1 small nuclear ribonucleo protein G, putative [Entamoeba histolytica HM-1:IMSS]EMD47446.1 small nuclear ribonucleo protein G, putative [Entamoeba histolytica KU27]EMH75905.1 LSM domain containing protein [Entamoeba histolytica HM-1:IMSS-B]EMS14250.1 small nuclear ribonucleo protein G, putative [Entamoeba histolytica HM-3:IMSS]ENY60477.1 small nuclear ribonucleo protein G, putative [Entamoeba histolytica HM-1:IMSS-A]GAT96284.1|eukprot:XP_008856779.1 LSM domain containing protein [Entamoeba nuttalli P19]